MNQADEKALDRRARRTRRQLKEALFALILEKGYDAVTIEDITERADLGRTTFYLHYRDKEELLLEAIDGIAQDLIERLPPQAFNIAEPPAQGSASDRIVEDAILIAFQHAAENAQLYRIILRGEGATHAHARLQTIIAAKAAGLLQERVQANHVRPQVPLDVFSNYLAGSLMATITWWLEMGMPYPPEQMAEMFRMMFFQGGRKVLGLD